jgi:hypothetical protein
MPKYPNAFKERVVREYKKGVRGKGFAALSKRFIVPNQLSKLGGNSGLLAVAQLKPLKTELEVIEEAC